MHRACPDTLAAPDALIAVWCLMRIDIHCACLGAGAAIHTFLPVYAHADQTYLLEESVKSPQRTYVFTERSVDEDRCRDTQNQQEKLPSEQPAHLLLPDPSAGSRSRLSDFLQKWKRSRAYACQDFSPKIL